MAECKIILRLNNGTFKEFDSDMELDGWLFDHRSSIGIDKGGDVQYSVSPQDDTNGVVTDLIRYRAEVSNSARSHGLIENLGNKAAVTTSYTKIANKMGKRSAGNMFLTPITNYRSTSTAPDPMEKVRKEIGYDFENAIKIALGRTPDTWKTIHNADRQAELIAEATKIVKALKAKHGNDAMFKLGVKVAAKTLSSNFERSLHVAGLDNDAATGGSTKEINAFVGDIDLLVIDSAGVAHVYDFKASKDNISVSTHPGYAHQIAAYAQILKQWGVEVGTVGLIPIKVHWNTTIDPAIGGDNVSKFTGYGDRWLSELEPGNSAVRLVEDWFPPTKVVKYKDLEDLQKVMHVCAPNTGLDQLVSFRESEIEEEFAKRMSVREDHPLYAADKGGMRYQYKKVGRLESGEERWIYAKTEEELKKKIEAWVNTYNERRAKTYASFAESLKKVMRSGSVSELKRIAEDYNNTDTNFIVTAFRRYVTGKWNLISDETMLANGIMLFQSGDIMELVMLDSHNPYTQIKWDHGNTRRKYTSVLGAFRADDEDTDGRWVLSNFYGNMVMLKGLVFLGQHQDFFRNCKLNKVSMMCLHSNALMIESNEKLATNYRLLTEEYQRATGENLNLLSIGHEINSDSSAYVHIAMDLLAEYEDEYVESSGAHILTYNKAFQDMQDRAAYTLHEIENMIKALKNEKGSKLYNVEHIRWEDANAQALQYLYRAYLSKLGYQVSPEIRVGSYSTGGLNLNGMMARSFADSRSAIARTLHEATYSFTRICQTEFVRYTAEWKKTIQKWYEELGHDKLWGGEYNLFERFFQHNPDGKLSSTFMLKEKGKMTTPTENKILDMIYDALDRFQYGKGFVDDRYFMDNVAKAKSEGTYGEVPLIKSHLIEKAGKMNPFKAILEDCKTEWNVMRDFLLGVDISADEVKELNDIDAVKIPALVFRRDGREERLNKNGTDNYTTDLDFIYNMIVAQGLKERLSPQILMTASAIRASMAYAAHLGANVKNKADMSNQEEAIKKYIQRKLFNRPIFDESLKNAQKVINVLKGLTSFVTLGVNFRAFTRETITGMERALVKIKEHPELKKLIDINTYKDAVEDIIKNCYKNTDVMSWHMQLNAIYGTANFSYDQMAEASKVNQYGLRNLQISDFYFTATWPDFIHRNAIVIAYLKKIGAYDAYSLKDGVLTYDMDKDKRFEILRKYPNRESCPLTSIHEYDEAYRRYLDDFESWKLNGYRNPDGSEFKLGDKLPQALSPRRVLGLKDLADRMYGNYDTETKSLMRDTLLGSLFLQFRTYGINRLLEFFDGDTPTSDIEMVTEKIKNSSGEEEDAYLVFETDTEAVMNGEKPAYRRVPKSEVNLEDIRSGKAVLARHPSSYHLIGGQVQTIIDVGASLFQLKDQEEFEKFLNSNPAYKANLALFMIDTFGMLLFALLVNMMYGEAMQGDYNEIDWFTKWSYNVAIGVAQDGPVWSVLSSVVGDGSPPMLGALQNYINNIGSVITGKKNFFYGVANTFGATRELAYLFDSR